MFTLSRLGIFAYNMMWAKRSLKVILVWVAHLIQFVCLSVNIKPVEVITSIMVHGAEVGGRGMKIQSRGNFIAHRFIYHNIV